MGRDEYGNAGPVPMARATMWAGHRRWEVLMHIRRDRSAKRRRAGVGAVLVVAGSTAGTWMLLDGADATPARSPVVETEGDVAESLADGGLKVTGELRLLEPATTARVALAGEVVLHAATAGSAQLILRDVVVDGTRTTLRWSGTSPIVLDGGVGVDRAVLRPGSTLLLEVDAGSLSVGAGVLHLLGPIDRLDGATKSAPTTSGRAGRPGTASQTLDSVRRIEFDEGSSITVIGRVLITPPVDALVILRAPVSVAGAMAVSGPRIADGRYQRIDVATGEVVLRIGTSGGLAFDQPIEGEARLVP